ncbi:MAG: transporter [Planctomycetota bacterium]
MKATRLTLGFCLCMSLFAAEAPAPATPELAADKAEKAEKPDKSRYNLFNPVPKDQMREMDLDRPDKTNSPTTIDAGHFQLESTLAEYFRERDAASHTRTAGWDFGLPNMRLGVLNDLELNTSLNYCYTEERTVDGATGQVSHQRGLGDTVVGGKYNFFGNDGEDHLLKTALAIQPQFKIPTAHDGLGNGKPELLAIIPFSLTLPKEFSLALQPTPGWERSSANTGYVTSFQSTVELSHPLVKNLDAYVEHWFRVTTEKHQKGQNTLDFGTIYHLTHNLTVDTAVNLGLNQASRRVEWITGVTLRF